jgi:hypothetical protein
LGPGDLLSHVADVDDTFGVKLRPIIESANYVWPAA